MGGGTSKDGRGGLEVVVGGKSGRDQQPLVGRLGKPVLSTAESPGKQLRALDLLVETGGTTELRPWSPFDLRWDPSCCGAGATGPVPAEGLLLCGVCGAGQEKALCWQLCAELVRLLCSALDRSSHRRSSAWPESRGRGLG